MLNPPYAVFSSDQIFFKTQHEFPKGKSSQDSDAEKTMPEILEKIITRFFSSFPKPHSYEMEVLL